MTSAGASASQSHSTGGTNATSRRPVSGHATMCSDAGATQTATPTAKVAPTTTAPAATRPRPAGEASAVL